MKITVSITPNETATNACCMGPIQPAADAYLNARSACESTSAALHAAEFVSLKVPMALSEPASLVTIPSVTLGGMGSSPLRGAV